jgi:hypothetical protein
MNIDPAIRAAAPIPPSSSFWRCAIAELRFERFGERRIGDEELARVGDLQDLPHPVVEAFGRAVEEHQRGVARNEFQILRFDTAAAERDPF